MARFLLVAWMLVLQLQPWMGLSVAATPTPDGFGVRLHPDGGLHAGDWVSIEVFSPPGENYDRTNLYASLQGAVARELGSAPFYGTAGGRFRAILLWVWDTGGLAAGEYMLELRIPERDLVWQVSVTLLPPEPAIQQHQWVTAETGCCYVHVISGTAAERDLGTLLPMIQAQAEDASRKIGASLGEKIHINLIPRILGQGGFTSSEVYVSYDDDNYANQDVEQLLHHELVHRYDAIKDGQLRPAILIEGLAVFLSGGHYQPEAVRVRAAALYHSGNYIPLKYLSDHFYPSQHESGYIIAGALVGYMVERWGWDTYDNFYRSIAPNDGGQAAALDAALRQRFGLSLDELESGFLGSLEEIPPLPDVQQDVSGTMRLFDAVRDFQREMDTSAYFESVWLPDAKDMRDRGFVADYLRGPDDPENLRVEAELLEAQQLLDEGEFALLAQKLAAVEQDLRFGSAQ